MINKNTDILSKYNTQFWRLCSNLPSKLLFLSNKSIIAYSLHVILALLFFSPFFLFGHVLFANTDLLTENYPMLLLAKKNFLHGDPGLWNPFVFSGAPSSLEANTPIFFPENWILFLVPLKFLFPVLTFLAFLKMCFIGIAGYWFFCVELLNRRWALFASTIYQLCGFTIWVITAYVPLSILLYFTLLLVLIWTSRNRSGLTNYLLYSLVTCLMLLAGNVSHAAYALLAAGVLFLYRTMSQNKKNGIVSPSLIFAGSSLTAMMIAAVRFLPIITTLHSSSTLKGCCPPQLRNGSFMISRLFDSEILGVNYKESVSFFSNISPLFNGYHIHFIFPDFFGVISALLVVWGFFSNRNGREVFWSIYTFIVLAIETFTQPFDAFFRMLLSPAYHPISLHFFLPIGFSTLAAMSGRSIEQALRRKKLSEPSMRLFKFSSITIAFMILFVIIQNISIFHDPGSNWARILVPAISVSLAALFWALKYRTQDLIYLYKNLLWIVILLSFVVSIFFDSLERNPTYLSHLKNVMSELFVFASVAMLLLHLSQKQIEKSKNLLPIFGSMGLLCLISDFFPWTNRAQLNLSHDQSLSLGGLGFLLYFLALSIFLMLIYVVRENILSFRSLYPVFFLLLLCEQIPGGKIHGHINANPFYGGMNLFPRFTPPLGPDGIQIKPDFADYRVNFPNTMLALPFYSDLYGKSNEICASFNVAYGIRSYGGYTDIIPDRIAKFTDNWIHRGQPTDLCIYENAKDARFLDLSGVRYDYHPVRGFISKRTGAMSRFMLFSRYENMPDSTILNRLKDANFQPLEQLAISENPGFESHFSPQNGKVLKYIEQSSSKIKIHVHTDGPSLLFFGDSYNEGWKVSINGKRSKILIANYNFMAVPLPGGNNGVLFEFKPRAYRIGTLISEIGVGIYLVFCGTYLVRNLRIRIQTSS